MGLVHHPNVVTDGLIGCWDAGNRRSYPTTGTTWTDLADGNNSTLVNGGSGLTFDSANGGSIVFDGTNDYTTATNFDNVSPVSGTNSFAFDMWIYLDDTNPITFITQRVDDNNRWSWWWNASSNMYFESRASGSGEGSSGAYNHSFTADNWYHLALVRDGNTILFYIDSVLKYSASFTGSIAAKAAGLNFGYDQQNYASLNGKIALVHAYNKALTAAEIKQNYKALKPRFTPRITKSGLVGNWDAGDPECYVGGTTCKDIANGTTATFKNWDGGNQTTGEANFNSANGGYWEFDGTDQYIQCSTNSVLQPQSFSVEAWAKESTDGGEVLALPIVTWKSGGTKYPAVYTSYHTAQKPIIFLSGSDYRDFDKTAVSVAGWHHVMFTYTYDDVTTSAFYVDGVSIAAVTTDDGTKDSTDACDIGRADTSLYYKGSIALVRIYDNALSAAEILDNYNKTKARFGH